MASDFFRRQDRARSQSRRLVVALVLWLLVTVGIIVAIFGAITFFGAEPEDQIDSLAVMDQGLAVALALVLVALGGALLRYFQLRRGANAVMDGLGGRQIIEGMGDAGEVRLLNVVTEMAIASGVPVPSVWVIDDAKGINAFAVGWSADDAAVAVTPEALKAFNRAELQGVIAHEFSHLVNGDSHINLRLTCSIAGITAIAVLGRKLLSASRGSRSKNNGGLQVVGLVMFLIGLMGVWVGRALQAAVSRQREVLADASAVQFTRNPAGLRGALMKIGGFVEAGHIGPEKYDELAHCFFVSSARRALAGLFATHPSIESRIEALGGVVLEDSAAWTSPSEGGLASAFAGVRQPVDAVGAVVVPDGEPGPSHPVMALAVRSALDATAHCLALLEPDHERLEACHDAGLRRAIAGAFLRQINLDLAQRLELLERCGPQLRRLSDEQAAASWRLIDGWLGRGGDFRPIDAAVMTIAGRWLNRRPKPPIRAIGDEAVVLLSAAALASQGGAGFEAGLACLEASLRFDGKLLSAEDLDTRRVAGALERFQRTAPRLRRSLCLALTEVVRADELICMQELALLRCFFASLGVPLPRLA